MNKRILMALSSTAAVAALSVGTTLALFSDSESGSGEFVAGNVCITAERNDGDTVPGPMFYIKNEEDGATPDGLSGIHETGLWAPGDSHTRTLTVNNPRECSTMDVYLTEVSARLTEGITDQYVEMADVLHVVVTARRDGVDIPVASGKLSDFLTKPVLMAYPPDGDKVLLKLTGNMHMTFTVTFDPNAGNDYQDKTLVVDFIVHAEQVKNNP